MTTVSITRKIQVYDQATLSTLGAAAASLSPGQSIRIADVPNNAIRSSSTVPLPDGSYESVADTFITWANKGWWNPITREVGFLGADAGGDSPFWWGSYSDVENTWRPYNYKTPFPQVYGTTLGHMYDGNAMDAVNGHAYFRQYGQPVAGQASNAWKHDGENWVALPTVTSANTGTVGSFEFFQGVGLIHSSGRRMIRYDESTNAWLTWQGRRYDSNGVDIGGADDLVSAYNAVENCLIVGGDSWPGSNPPAGTYHPLNYFPFTRYDPDGTATEMDEAPWTIALGGAGGTFIGDPASKYFLAARNRIAEPGKWAQLDPDTGAWTLLTQSIGDGSTPQNGTPAFGSQDRDRAMIVIPISTYGVTMWIRYTGSAGECWLYKHA